MNTISHSCFKVAAPTVIQREPEVWIYIGGEDQYNDEYCVYGQTILNNGSSDYFDAQTQILSGRFRSGMGKYAKIKLDTGRVKLVKVINVTEWAKKYGFYGNPNYKIDQELIKRITHEDEREGTAESVSFGAKELIRRIEEFLVNDIGHDPSSYLPDTIVAEKVEPRCPLHTKDLQDFHNDYNKFIQSMGVPSDPATFVAWQVHMDQLAACGSGKSTTPILVYDNTIEPHWNFEKGNPINLVTCDNIKNLCNNLFTIAGHLLATGKKAKCVVFAGMSDDPTTLNYIQALGIDVCKNKREFSKYIDKYSDTHTIWIFTTYHSYYYKTYDDEFKTKLESSYCLTKILRQLGKEIFFAYIDEWHRTIQPPSLTGYMPWAAIHDDNLLKIYNRFKCSASERDIEAKTQDADGFYVHDPLLADKHKQYFHMDKYNDVRFKRLTEEESAKRGYTRFYKILDFHYPSSLLDAFTGNEDIKVVFDKGKEPLIRVKDANGNNIDAPFRYYTSAISQLFARTLGKPISHTLAVANTLDNANLFCDFFKAVRPTILNDFITQGLLTDENDPLYQCLLNIYIDVMDKRVEANTIKIFNRIDEIPVNHKDSIIIHCQVATTGYNAGATLKNELRKKHFGFINSVTFIDRVEAADRIQQNAGRAARNPKSQPDCYLILNHITVRDEETGNKYNRRFGYLRYICEKLEIGTGGIGQNIEFYDCTNLGGGNGGTRNGKSPAPLFELGTTSGLNFKWLTYLEHGEYHPLFELVDKIGLRYIELDRSLHGYLSIRKIEQKINNIIKNEFPDYFKFYSDRDTYLYTIKNGSNPFLSDKVGGMMSQYTFVEREKLKTQYLDNLVLSWIELDKKYYSYLFKKDHPNARKLLIKKYAEYMKNCNKNTFNDIIKGKHPNLSESCKNTIVTYRNSREQLKESTLAEFTNIIDDSFSRQIDSDPRFCEYLAKFDDEIFTGRRQIVNILPNVIGKWRKNKIYFAQQKLKVYNWIIENLPNIKDSKELRTKLLEALPSLNISNYGWGDTTISNFTQVRLKGILPKDVAKKLKQDLNSLAVRGRVTGYVVSQDNKITCPHCGEKVTNVWFGRKHKNGKCI